MSLTSRKIKGQISGSQSYQTLTLVGEPCSIKDFKNQLKRWSNTTWGSDITLHHLELLTIDSDTKTVYLTPTKPFGSILSLQESLKERLEKIPKDFTVWLGYDVQTAKPFSTDNLRLFLKGEFQRTFNKPTTYLGILSQPDILITDLT